MRATRPSTTKGLARGFTLVELAVVLVIMGLLGLLVYGPVFDLVRKEKLRDGAEMLEKVADRLRGQAAVYGSLPDPGPGGTVPAGVGQPDPWSRPVLYWLAPELSGAVRIRGVPGASLGLRTYRTVGSGGPFPAADAELLGQVENLAAVLVSTGPNHTQQVTVSGSGGQTVINVLRGGGPMQDGSGANFDDLVLSISLGELKTLAP